MRGRKKKRPTQQTNEVQRTRDLERQSKKQNKRKEEARKKPLKWTPPKGKPTAAPCCSLHCHRTWSDDETTWLRTYVANLPPGDEYMFLADRTVLRANLVDGDENPRALHNARRNTFTLEEPDT